MKMTSCCFVLVNIQINAVMCPNLIRVSIYRTLLTVSFAFQQSDKQINVIKKNAKDEETTPDSHLHNVGKQKEV